MDWNIVLTCLAICSAKILEISIQSLKTVCMVKGERKIAALLAFIECLVWGFVISSVITSLSSNVWLLLSYCIGYASGLFIGSIIESKIALGTSNIQIMVDKEHVDAVEKYLIENSHGFTIFDGHGSKEEMCMIIMVLARKDVKCVMKEIKKICDDNVFMISSEVSKFVGGYGIRK
jgi:uncharacterized protein YebE (UPF0316 family)